MTRGDPERLAEVIQALVMNGVEALPPAGGRVGVNVGVREVRLSDGTPPEPWGELAPGRYAFVEVSDDGAGMDEATRARMFDPFFSTKFTGRGLGLAAVLGVVRAHEGAINVRTAPGVGTTVTVLLPAA